MSRYDVWLFARRFHISVPKSLMKPRQNLLKRFRRLLIKVSRIDIRECCANSHTSYLDITLKSLYLGGIVHVAKSCLLVDENFGFTVEIETTHDTFPAVRKHLDSLGVPFLTFGSRGLVEKSNSFVPSLDEMLVIEG